MIAVSASVQDLESWSEAQFGCSWDEDAEQTLLPNGSCLACCTNGARYIVGLLGRGEVFGFYDHENPGTDPGQLAGGHDFAVIDDRWIVDIWAKHFSGIADRCVFDFLNPADSDEIRRLFGDRMKWKRM